MTVDITPPPELVWGIIVACVSAALWAAGDKRYVRRKPYHDAIDTLTANTSKVQEDVNQLKTAVAVLTNSMCAMSANVQKAMEHNAEMSKTISEIRVDVGCLAATWKGAWALKHGQWPESEKRPGQTPATRAAVNSPNPALARSPRSCPGASAQTSP